MQIGIDDDSEVLVKERYNKAFLSIETTRKNSPSSIVLSGDFRYRCPLVLIWKLVDGAKEMVSKLFLQVPDGIIA